VPGDARVKEDWLELGRDLTRRGLAAPMLIVADGAPGLIGAIEELWARADRQHCTVHRLRNLLSKLPKKERDRVRRAYWHALDEATSQPDGTRRLQVLIDDLRKAGFEAAGACLAEDLPALVVHLRYPLRHRRRWRSTNLLERSLGEVRRRTKVIGRFPGETSCLSLVWAVLDLIITHATNGATFTDLDRQHLYQLKCQPAEPSTLEEVTAA
jgi:transposase-like protein